MIFSDESKIVIGRDSRVYVWRKHGAGWRPDLVAQRNLQPCCEVMIWRCVSWHVVGTITSITGNINADSTGQQFMAYNSLSFSWRKLYFSRWQCAPVHHARSTQDFIHRNGIRTMSWPAQSPDINIIENLWLLIKRKLQMHVEQIKSKDDLFREIRDIWTENSPAYIKCLYQSIPCRILI